MKKTNYTTGKIDFKDDSIVIEFNNKKIIINTKIFVSKYEILNLSNVDSLNILRTLSPKIKYYVNNRGLFSIKNNVNTIDFSKNSVGAENEICDSFYDGFSIYILYFEYFKNFICRDANFEFADSSSLKIIFSYHKNFNLKSVFFNSEILSFNNPSKYNFIKIPKLLIPNFDNEIKLQNIKNIKLEQWSNLYTVISKNNVMSQNNVISQNNVMLQNTKFNKSILNDNPYDVKFAIDILKRCNKNLEDTSNTMFTERTLNINTYIVGDIPYDYIINFKNNLKYDIIYVCENNNDRNKLTKFISNECCKPPKIIVANSYENAFENVMMLNKPQIILKLNDKKIEIYAKDKTIWEIENSIIPKNLYLNGYGTTGFRVMDD